MTQECDGKALLALPHFIAFGQQEISIAFFEIAFYIH
jgi:hypothetical protein